MKMTMPPLFLQIRRCSIAEYWSRWKPILACCLEPWTRERLLR